MGGNGITVKTRNFIIFRTAEAVVGEGRETAIVTGLRIPFFKGRYQILVDRIGYGKPRLPSGIGKTLEEVKAGLEDSHELPETIPVREY